MSDFEKLTEQLGGAVMLQWLEACSDIVRQMQPDLDEVQVRAVVTKIALAKTEGCTCVKIDFRITSGPATIIDVDFDADGALVGFDLPGIELRHEPRCPCGLREHAPTN